MVARHGFETYPFCIDIPSSSTQLPTAAREWRAGANATRGRKGGHGGCLCVRNYFHIADRAPRLALGDPRITWTSNYLTWCNRNVTVIQNWR